jgi:ABC-type transporter Mla maintaining outer membrane lipid asymmetry ATPase subunit MlaF
MDRFTNKYEINEIDSIESLIIKLISGDKSDNISAVWSQVKNGKKRGIGEKGAKGIYDEYLTEFGEISLTDPDLYENIADLICEKKKLSKTQIEAIVENLIENVKLIDLRIDNIPTEIVKTMEEKFSKFI